VPLFWVHKYQLGGNELDSRTINRRRFIKDCLIVSAGAGLASCRSTPATKPAQTPPKTDSKLLLYAGTYAGNDAESLFVYQMDPVTGALESVDAFKAGANPSFLALHPAGKYLYAVNESGVSAGQAGGAVSAFSIDPQSGKLILLNRQASQGSGPCHLNMDRTGAFVLVANYSSGSLAVLPVAADGRLNPASQVVQHTGHGPNSGRQEGPHAHSIVPAPDNRFVLSCDLGIDKMFVYAFDSGSGSLQTGGEAVFPPGSGPRHLDFHPAGRHVYVISELTATLTAFSYAAETGATAPIQTLSTLPEGYTGAKSGAEVYVHPSGRFVYGSNRGHDSIVIFSIDEATGMMTLVGHEPTRGRTPRNFAIDPTGTFLLAANQDGNSIVVFRIDSQTGRLGFLQSVNVSKPVCLRFLVLESQG
jgi:6-phosphogluconolactonase